MDKQEWRGRFKRGDAWRSTTAETCGICGSKSNLWEMGGYPGMGPRLICPGRRKYPQLHEQLVKKKLSVSDNGHYGRDYLPKSIIKELQEEIKQDLEKFRKVKPNIVLPPPLPL